MRNLGDECKHCFENEQSIMMCIEICGVPTDILEEYENRRNEKEKNEHERYNPFA